MKLSDLKFDCPNNSCQSLRFLAEMVRTGEIQVNAIEQNVGGLRINVSDKNTRVKLEAHSFTLKELTEQGGR